MKSVAIVGASSRRQKYGNKAVRAYLHAGWTVYPINPAGGTIEEQEVYRSLADLPETPDRISVYLPPHITTELLPEMLAVEAGDVMLNHGSADRTTIARAQEIGLDVIQACSIVDIGLSPSMFP